MGAEENIYIYTVRIMEGWRKMHNELLHNLCASPDTIRVIK